jgi:hypothetical protein
MINSPPSGFQSLQETLRSLKREIIDEALSEMRRRMSGSFTASGQIAATALGGTVPLTSLPDLPGANAEYVTTAPNASLSAEKVLPFLANWSNDIPSTLGFMISALQWEDDFDNDALDAAWLDTAAGVADYVSETDAHGYLWLEHAAAAERGVYRTVTPVTNMTFVAKLSYSLPTTNAYTGFVLTDSSDTPIATATIQRTATAVQARTGASGGTTVAMPGFYYSDTIYLLLLKGGTSYDLFISRHGFYPWERVATFTQAGTVARLRLIVNGQAGADSAISFIDFARAYDIANTTIGGVP